MVPEREGPIWYVTYKCLVKQNVVTDVNYANNAAVIHAFEH